MSASISAAPIRPKGEPFVWLTSIGLSMGLAMIVAILTLITTRGLSYFWPNKVESFTVDAAAGLPLKGSLPVIAGIVQEENTRLVDGKPRMRYKLYVGNRALYGDTFVWLDADRVVARGFDENMISVESHTDTRSLLVPVCLTRADGSAVPATAPEFADMLEEAIAAGYVVHDSIEEIVKGRIGSLNRDVLDLQVTLYRAEKSHNKELAAETAAKLTELKSEIDRLSAEQNELRRKNNLAYLTARSSTGLETRVPIGEIVSLHWPNRLSLPERFWLSLKNFYDFVFSAPRHSNTEGGIFPAIFGTFLMTVLMCVIVTPFGVIAAVYLREYARQGLVVNMVRIAINNLSGVPSIVFGAFGLGFFVYFVGGHIDELFFKDWEEVHKKSVFASGGLLWASLTLALLTLPVVIVSTEEALAAVSRGAREGSLACGASKWQMIYSVILPASMPGIITGMILAMARGAGEVAPLMVVGLAKNEALPTSGQFPFIHFSEKFNHLGFHIYDLGFQSPDSQSSQPILFATTFLLLMMVAAMNLAGIIIRQRLRRRYVAGAF